MTIWEARKKGAALLEQEGLENARAEADILLAHVLQQNHTQLLLLSQERLQEHEKTQYIALLQKRTEGEPLQYLLGEWDFLELRLHVGGGVLIPRPETEQLALLAMEAAGLWEKPVVLDLCAGSGCIGLAIAKACPQASVYLLEYSKQAFFYLQKNISSLDLPNVKPVLADIRLGFRQFALPQPHMIVSNPPYIPTAELSSLQREVRREPLLALDGGVDGLAFYRMIQSLWFPFLKPGGSLFLECGEGQAGGIEAMFQAGAMQAPGEPENPASTSAFPDSNKIHITIKKDFNAIARILVIETTNGG